MKTCSTCERDLPESEYPTRKRKDGTRVLRARCKECERLQDERAVGHGRYLPVEPFREWLEQKIAQHDKPKDVSELLNLSPRRLWQIRNRSKLVSLYLVDDCLTNDGTTMLWELYPDA